MRPTLLYIVALVVVLTSIRVASAQYRPFDKYVFEQGGYSLVGVFQHHKDHPIQKKIGEFYTDDLEVLNSIKKAWNFRRKQKIYACGYHYYITLLKNGKSVDDFSINLDCKEIVTERGSRYFNGTLLTRFSSKLRPLFSRSSNFLTIDEARNVWAKMIADSSFVYADEPAWLKYQGKFGFRSQCPAEDRDCYFSGHDAEILAAVKAKISSTYPGERFELRSNGGSSTGEIFFEIICDRSLESKFIIFDRWNKEGFGKWVAFPLNLHSYWKQK